MPGTCEARPRRWCRSSPRGRRASIRRRTRRPPRRRRRRRRRPGPCGSATGAGRTCPTKPPPLKRHRLAVPVARSYRIRSSSPSPSASRTVSRVALGDVEGRGGERARPRCRARGSPGPIPGAYQRMSPRPSPLASRATCWYEPATENIVALTPAGGDGPAGAPHRGHVAEGRAARPREAGARLGATGRAFRRSDGSHGCRWRTPCRRGSSAAPPWSPGRRRRTAPRAESVRPWGCRRRPGTGWPTPWRPG